MFQTIKKLVSFLDKKEKSNAIKLLLAILIMSLLDLIGVASIMPLISLISNPEIINNNKYLFFVYNYLQFNSFNKFLLFFGQIILCFFLFSIIVKILTTYINLKFTVNCEFNISKRLIEGYFKQPYEWFLNKNSSEIGKNILSEINMVISSGLMPLISLISNLILIILFLTMLFFYNTILTLKVIIILASTYIFIYNLSNSYLKIIGKERAKSNESRFNVIIESFGGIKEVKFGNFENFYLERYLNYAKKFYSSHRISLIIGQLPRFALEGIAFGSIIILLIVLISTGSTLNTVIPTIALYTVAGYRLMPALQQIYTSITQIQYSQITIDNLSKEFSDLNINNYNINSNVKNINFDKTLILKSIYYKYPKTDRYILNNINLTIPQKSKIGIIGSTGSGKTTTIDIILGLLNPNKGIITVDGVELDEKNRINWQKQIGYVPQNIFLTDDTIAGNIAFGIDSNDINFEKVENAAKISNLHEFIINELPDGYFTQIGERGVRLSGGQRQRIGIARSLYNNPKILILDEATSALDNQTELLVMQAINNLSNSITIVIIAHRLSTVKNCDNIYVFKNGNIIGEGKYHELKILDLIRE
jgi:ABC-type multidrug transport system fused ATPase/permease subunit